MKNDNHFIHVQDILEAFYTFYPPSPLIIQVRWNLSVTTTSLIKFIICDLFSYVS